MTASFAQELLDLVAARLRAAAGKSQNDRLVALQDVIPVLHAVNGATVRVAVVPDSGPAQGEDADDALPTSRGRIRLTTVAGGGLVYYGNRRYASSLPVGTEVSVCPGPGPDKVTARCNGSNHVCPLLDTQTTFAAE